MRPCNEKGLPIFPKCQIIRLFQFAAWRQQVLRKHKILFRLEAKLFRILDGLINHLLCQLDRALHRLSRAENFVTDLALVTTAGKTSIGKSIFEAQAERIYKVNTKTDITIRLLSGHKYLHKSQIILFIPIVADQTFVKRVASSTAKDS